MDTLICVMLGLIGILCLAVFLWAVVNDRPFVGVVSLLCLPTLPMVAIPFFEAWVNNDGWIREEAVSYWEDGNGRYRIKVQRGPFLMTEDETFASLDEAKADVGSTIRQNKRKLAAKKLKPVTK